jgi:hypothetical protein
MKLLLILVLYFFLNGYSMQYYKGFSQKILKIIISLHFLLEYIIIFLLKNNYIYNLILYLYKTKETFYYTQKMKTIYVINTYKKEQKKIKNKPNYITKI